MPVEWEPRVAEPVHIQDDAKGVTVGDQRVRGCGVEMQPGEDPAECVLDIGRGDLCLYADEIRRREECQWWREPEAAAVGCGRTNEHRETFENRTTRTAGNDPAAGADPAGPHPGRRDKAGQKKPAPEISRRVQGGDRNSKPAGRSPRKLSGP